MNPFVQHRLYSYAGGECGQFCLFQYNIEHYVTYFVVVGLCEQFTTNVNVQYLQKEINLGSTCWIISTKYGLLLCWQHLLIRHLLDVMHCEKKLCENIVKTIFGEKDYTRAWMGMKDMLVQLELWLQPKPNRPNEYFRPQATYVLSPQERKMLDVIENLKAPTHYVSSIHRRVADGRLRFLKSHDFHIVMQQVRNTQHWFYLNYNSYRRRK
jgi:hypothetical protein